MKLYTEEQVKKMLDLARFTYNSEDKILLSQIPIELPSDEEIWDKADEELSGVRHYAFMRGAKWLLEKIQGGEQ